LNFKSQTKGKIFSGLSANCFKHPSFYIKLVSSGYLALRVLKVRDIFWVETSDSTNPSGLLRGPAKLGLDTKFARLSPRHRKQTSFKK